MSLLVPLTMFGWIPLVIVVFSRIEKRRAVIGAFIAAWLFLPVVSYPLPGLPDYTKMSATCWGILLSAMMYDGPRMRAFRLQAVDMPVLVWCLCPMASSLTNGLGLYDGFSETFRQSMTWGLPYVIGRVYCGSPEGIRDLALGLFAGGLVYIPFCLYEIRMSPQLHHMVYGFHQHDFGQSIRYGGFRPIVFMEHGLMVGMWMAGASLIGIWLWVNRIIVRFWGMPMAALVGVLVAVTVLCKSTGALGLLVVGLAALMLTKRFKTPVLILCLVAVPAGYLATRATGLWSGDNLVQLATEVVGAKRAQSLEFRFQNENILAEKALHRPVFGWGGWGRARVYDDSGKDITVTDGLWIIAFGNNGMVGLISLTAALVFPVLLLMRRHPPWFWQDPEVAPAAALAVLVALFMIDNLLNAMINPIYMLIAGGVVGLPGRESIDARQAAARRGQIASQAPAWRPRYLSAVLKRRLPQRP